MAALEDATEGLAGAHPDIRISDDPAPYLIEPRGRWQGRGIVMAPGSTEAVAALVRAAYQARVAIVPLSGGTGLVGGQVVVDGPVPLILSLERMNKIRDVWPKENALVAEAGAILADVQSAAARVDRLFALSLASEGSARIGGLLATNAGGVNVLRYGNARAQVLGVEAVMADGTVLRGLSRLRKDNTGYDLRHLLVGSEGTLGIITAAALMLSPRPTSEAAAFVAVAGPSAALDLLELAQARLGEAISACELIHRQGPDFLREVGPEVRLPMDPMPDWAVLIDAGLGGGGDAGAQLEALLAEAMERGIVSDGVLSQSQAERAALWHLRESIPAANRRIGAISSHDISLPLSEIAGFVATAPAEIARIGEFRINCFGHLGDGNLHYNVFPKSGGSRADHEDQRAPIKRLVHDMVAARGGSVSAEHGIGRLKVDDLERYGDPAKLSAMRAIKAALDPQGILNPGAVLRLPN